MILSKRLSAIAGLIPPGCVIADVGTDHGYIPIYAVREGICPRAYALDVRQGPLDRAQAHVREEGLEDAIALRLSDGLAAMRPGEADFVVIAGMGGALMLRILDEGKDVLAGVRGMILAPQSETDRVRARIRESAFAIRDEDMVLEDDKFYPILLLERREAAEGGAGTENSADTALQAAEDPEGQAQAGPDRAENIAQTVEDRYGPVLLAKEHPALREYLAREEALCRRILAQIGEKGGGENGDRIRELEDRLALNAAAVKRYRDFQGGE